MTDSDTNCTGIVHFYPMNLNFKWLHLRDIESKCIHTPVKPMFLNHAAHAHALHEGVLKPESALISKAADSDQRL